MDYARKLVDHEQAVNTSASGYSETIASDPPLPINVIVPPAKGSKLERAYKLLELERLDLVNELGPAHLACVVSDLEDVVAAIEKAQLQVDHAPRLAKLESEQERLHTEWNAEIRDIINKKLGVE